MFDRNDFLPNRFSVVIHVNDNMNKNNMRKDTRALHKDSASTCFSFDTHRYSGNVKKHRPDAAQCVSRPESPSNKYNDMFNFHCSMCSVHASMINVSWSMSIDHCSLFNVQCSMFVVQFSSFNVHCAMFIVQIYHNLRVRYVV